MSLSSALPWAADAPAAPAAAGSAVALYARWSPLLDAKIAAAQERLREAVLQHGVGLLQSSSLGVEDMVVTDLLQRAGLRIDVATLDTGKLHAETLALIPRIQARYGVEVALFQPLASAVVEFVPRPVLDPQCDVKVLGHVTAAAFGQRRKMLRASLKQITSDPEGLLARVDLSPQIRGEQLSVEDFARLAAELAADRRGSR